MATFNDTGLRYSFVDLAIFTHNILQTVKSKTFYPYHFLQELNKIFQVQLNI